MFGHFPKKHPSKKEKLSRHGKVDYGKGVCSYRKAALHFGGRRRRIWQKFERYGVHSPNKIYIYSRLLVFLGWRRVVLAHPRVSPALICRPSVVSTTPKNLLLYLPSFSPLPTFRRLAEFLRGR